MPRYGNMTSYADPFARQFGVLWGVSVVAHVVLLAFFALVSAAAKPNTGPKETPVLMFDMADLADLPKGPGVGPLAPTESVKAALNPFEGKPKQTTDRLSPADMPENVKPTKKVNSKYRSHKTKEAVVRDTMAKSAIERLKQSKQEVGGGGEGKGDGGSVEKIYVARVRQKIKSRWKLPAGLSAEDRDRTATVVVRIDGSGNLLGFSLSKSTGVAALDATIKSAVQGAAPFSAPPNEAAERVAQGIGFTFKAKEAE
ncbi:MAG: TonB family protein [Deltaproteobacteria bacterium]|nr:TonB family protein [Deltaproteobacteria bacterium]